MFLFKYKYLQSEDGQMNRDFLDYIHLYDARNNLLELQNKRREVELNGDIDALNDLDDEIVNAVIMLHRYEAAMG